MLKDGTDLDKIKKEGNIKELCRTMVSRITRDFNARNII